MILVLGKNLSANKSIVEKITSVVEDSKPILYPHIEGSDAIEILLPMCNNIDTLLVLNSDTPNKIQNLKVVHLPALQDVLKSKKQTAFETLMKAKDNAPSKSTEKQELDSVKFTFQDKTILVSKEQVLDNSIDINLNFKDIEKLINIVNILGPETLELSLVKKGKEE